MIVLLGVGARSERGGCGVNGGPAELREPSKFYFAPTSAGVQIGRRFAI